MNKILKKLLVFVLALGAAIVPFTAVVAADTEEEGIMKEEYIVGTVNADCVIDAYGDNDKNAVKIQPADNGFAGVWLALPGLQAKKAGEKIHIEARIRFEAETLYGYSYADVVDNKGNVIDGQFKVNKWQNLIFDAEIYSREGKNSVFVGFKTAKNNDIYLSDVSVTDDVYETKNMFGGVKMTIIEPEKNQTEGFMLVTENKKIIMIDGGDQYDKDNVVKLIRQYKNEVDDWYISHYHCDHVFALIRILEEEDIFIKNLYYDFNVTDEILEKYGDEDNYLVARMKKAVGENRSKIGNVITPEKGNEFTTDGVKVKILNNATFRAMANMPNDSSIVFKVETPGKNILFLGDLGAYGDALLKDEYFYNEIQDCEVVQLGHHGQSGVSDKFYQSLPAMKVAIYCAPEWLFDCNSGKGVGSGSWLTLRTREIMRVLKIRKTCSLKYGRAELG